MSGVSGSGDIRAEYQQERPLEEVIAREVAEEKVKPGFEQKNSISQLQSEGDSVLSSPVKFVPTLPPILSEVADASSDDIATLQAKAIAAREELALASSTGVAERWVDEEFEAKLEENPLLSFQGQSLAASEVRGGTSVDDLTLQSSQNQLVVSSALQEMVSTVQAKLKEAGDKIGQDRVSAYENNVQKLAGTIHQAPAVAALSPQLQALSLVASHVSSSVSSVGSLVLQRVIDDIVSINRDSKGTSISDDEGLPLHSAEFFGMPEHVRLSLLSERLGIDLSPLVRKSGLLEGITATQRGFLLSLEALSNAEFLEKLQEALQETQVRDEQNKERITKLKQAIAALKAGSPKFAAEILNSASLITTEIEQIVDQYTSDETPGSLRQHLKEHLTQVLDSVIQEGSHQDMMKIRIELLQSAKRA